MPVEPLDSSVESSRLMRLRELVVLDSEPEPLFDELARLASVICDVPIALISLVDEERQWFKANVGLPGVNETARDVAFCAYAIQSDALFSVPDAAQDGRFAGNPLVTGTPNIRFYAGAPLSLVGGERVGTLCVIDRMPRELTAHQAEMLRALARMATQALEMRRDLINKTLSIRADYDRALALSEARHRALIEDQSELVSLARHDGELVYVNPAYARQFQRDPRDMIGSNLFDEVDLASRESVRRLIAEVFATGEVRTSENGMRGPDGQTRWVAWTNSLQRGADGDVLLHSVGRDFTIRKRAEDALRASQGFLYRTGRIAGVGGWEVDLMTGSIHWSDETRRIHEVEDHFVPEMASAIGFYVPEARQKIEAAVQRGVQDGTPWDLELQIVTARGRLIWVRTSGEVEFENAKPVRLVGAFQDIDERKASERALNELITIFGATSDFVVQANYRGEVTYMNPAVRRAVGMAPDASLSGRRFTEFNTATTNLRYVDTILPAVKAGGSWIGETTVLVEGGRELPVNHMVIAHRDQSGRVDRYSAVMRDISGEMEARQQLLRQTATLRSVTEAIPMIVGVVGADGLYRFANSGFERWFGSSRDNIIGRSLTDVLGSVEYERSLPWIERVRAGETVSFEREYPGRNCYSHLAFSYVPLWLEDGAMDGFVQIGQDITQHRNEEERLLQLSQRDPLTGLLNRAGFDSYMARQADPGAPTSLALLYIDLDHFKPVNDQHGHPVGDQVLQVFSQRLRALVRPSDAVARLGGDEFAIVLPGVREQANGGRVADKVVAAALVPFEIGILRLSLGASVGVAFSANASADLPALVARADAMLYRAKQAGRGRRAGG